MPQEIGGRVDPRKLNTMGGASDDAVVVKKQGHDSFQEARDEAVQKGKRMQQELEKKAEFDTRVEGAVDHQFSHFDWDKIERQVTGEEELAKKINGWRGGISPQNKTRLDALRKNRTTAQKPAQEKSRVAPEIPAETASTAAATPSTATEKPALKFNPFTGEALKEGELLKFDPLTGKPMEHGVSSQTLDLDKRLVEMKETLRQEFQKQTASELQKLRADLEAANKERQELIAERDRQKDMRRQEQEQRAFLEFRMAAKQSNIPDDLVNYAYERAREIVNDPSLNVNLNERDPAKRQMSYDDIFKVMRQTNGSFFHEKIMQSADPDAPVAGAIRPKAKAGTGTSTGGGSPSKINPQDEEHRKGADSFEKAGQLLRKAARTRFGG